ncbi:MAG: STAS-like domain-containing protein [Elusimicrobiota bacterium]
MRIQIKQYGAILTSRPAGKEAALAMKAQMRTVAAGEKVELDFDGVISIGPSWLDEILSALRMDYGRDRVICLPTKNASVSESLKAIDSGG